METEATTKACDYCTSEIPVKATRCPQCAGEFRYCKRCETHRGTKQFRKFVGLFRGGYQTQHRCMRCDLVVEGPKV